MARTYVFDGFHENILDLICVDRYIDKVTLTEQTFEGLKCHFKCYIFVDLTYFFKENTVIACTDFNFENLWCSYFVCITIDTRH